ncbi:iodotyrosine deiodinase 1-like [Anopheles albimanus]|uniref:Nitroreductase domain-containing protein n=1 Tax=Anopheles albimanus TaxID=7167 RepID=A0A182FHR9_ANOAL|nr:iodotyrosine deiodinase 1-like [Anopheles albimanus]
MASYVEGWVESLISSSALVNYWNYIFPMLVGLYLAISLYDKHRYGGRKKLRITSPPTDSATDATKKLDGMEYVGDLDGDSEEGYELAPALEEKPRVPYSGATVTLDKDPFEAADKFYAIVNDRRSVRKFSQRPVEREIVERCIQAAGTGPSGAHTEPWTFCLVSDRSIKESIREIIEAEELVNYTQRMAKQWVTDLRPIQTNHIKEYLTEAPHLILVFKQTYGHKADGKKKQHYYNEISTSIATGILLCALQSAGLSSLVTTPLNCGPALRNLLERPPNEKLLVLLPVGYAAEDCTVPDLQRKPLEQLIVRY